MNIFIIKLEQKSILIISWMAKIALICTEVQFKVMEVQDKPAEDFGLFKLPKNEINHSQSFLLQCRSHTNIN